MSSKGSSQILIVDDDPLVIRSLARAVQGLGDILFAKSGEAALQLMKKTEPDLVLLDGNMPGMNGFETCLAMKQDPRFDDLPILFVTAMVGWEREEEALKIGAVDFIGKPIRPLVVRARVQTHLELKLKNDALKQMASVDVLTNLANRRVFDEAIVSEWRRTHRIGLPLSLVMLDVDFFKKFNDYYGHPAGDACLQKVAQTISESVNRGGDLTARYGGEEFAIILPNTNMENAMQIAEMVRKKVEKLSIPHEASDASSHVTISMGISCWTPQNLDREDDKRCPECEKETCEPGPGCLIHAADLALYQAKRLGRNRVEVQPLLLYLNKIRVQYEVV